MGFRVWGRSYRLLIYPCHFAVTRCYHCYACHDTDDVATATTVVSIVVTAVWFLSPGRACGARDPRHFAAVTAIALVYEMITY